MASVVASAAASGSASGERLEDSRLSPSLAPPPKKPKIDDVVQDECKGSQQSEVVDPDDDMEWWTPAKISDEDMERYKKQVEESGGYDVDYIPGAGSCLLISPVLDFESRYDFWAKFAWIAVDHYNKDKEEDGKLVFLKLLKVNVDYGYPLTYLTFEAKDKAAVCQAKIYQAQVELGPGTKVKEFRQKPSQQNPS